MLLKGGKRRRDQTQAKSSVLGWPCSLSRVFRKARWAERGLGGEGELGAGMQLARVEAAEPVLPLQADTALTRRRLAPVHKVRAGGTLPPNSSRPPCTFLLPPSAPVRTPPL